MKQCPNCGASLPDNARWCSQCGTPLTSQNPSSQNNYNHQQAPQHSGPQPQYNPYQPQPEPPQNNNKSLVVAIWVVAALLLVAIILYFFVYNGKNNDLDLNDSANDTSLFSAAANPWDELEKLRQDAQNRRETIRVTDETPQHQEETPVATWSQRTINAKVYDANGDYPVKITFEENSDGQIRNCVFNNVNYGSKIPLRGRSTNDGYSFSGNTGGQQVSVTFENIGGQLQGHASIGNKELTITATIY